MSSLVDYERAWLQLAEHVTTQSHHGSRDLALKMLELSAANTLDESSLEQALRVQGVEALDGPDANRDRSADADGDSVAVGDASRSRPSPTRHDRGGHDGAGSNNGRHAAVSG